MDVHHGKDKCRDKEILINCHFTWLINREMVRREKQNCKYIV